MKLASANLGQRRKKNVYPIVSRTHIYIASTFAPAEAAEDIVFELRLCKHIFYWKWRKKRVTRVEITEHGEKIWTEKRWKMKMMRIHGARKSLWETVYISAIILYSVCHAPSWSFHPVYNVTNIKRNNTHIHVLFKSKSTETNKPTIFSFASRKIIPVLVTNGHDGVSSSCWETVKKLKFFGRFHLSFVFFRVSNSMFG